MVALLKPSYPVLFLCLKEIPFLLSFLVNIGAQLLNFVLYVIQFIVKFLKLRNICFYCLSKFLVLCYFNFVGTISVLVLIMRLITTQNCNVFKTFSLRYWLMCTPIFVNVFEKIRSTAVSYGRIKFIWRVCIFKYHICWSQML